MDAAGLERAHTALREQYGDRLAAPRSQMQPVLRRTLEQHLGLDEVSADRLVTELYQLGRLGPQTENTGPDAPPATTVEIPNLQTPASSTGLAPGILLSPDVVDPGSTVARALEVAPVPPESAPDDESGA